MSGKLLPFTKNQIEKIIKKYPTPFYIYDEKAIRENARNFKNAFAWNEGFKEFFAVKAAPNPFLMKILHKEGFGADCSSLPELVIAEKGGFFEFEFGKLGVKIAAGAARRFGSAELAPFSGEELSGS